MGNFSNKNVGKLQFRGLKYITSSKKQTWNLFSHVINLISNLINLIPSASVTQIVQVTRRHCLDDCDLITNELQLVLQNCTGTARNQINKHILHDYIGIQIIKRFYMIREKSKGGISSVQFSRSVMSDSLRPHESQHARPPCPSPTPGVHSDSRPSSL